MLSLTASSLLLVAACSRQDPTALDAGTAGTTTTTAAPTTTEAPTTTTAAVTTTEAPTTVAPTLPPTLPPTVPPTPAPTIPKPTTTSSPAGSAPIISPNAPPARPDVNIYDHIGPANANPATAGALARVYVPHEVSGTTSIIDPATLQVIGSFPSGPESQHVVPSYDMKTLYVVSGRGNKITPIDPLTATPGTPIPVEDPYNLYFTPDGAEAIVVVEGFQRLDFRDAHTFALHNSVQTNCNGLNHLDYSADFSYFIATCEFDGTLIKFDMASHSVVARLSIDMTPSGRRPRNGHAQPQDVRLSSDGTVFFVADLQSNGLYMIDGDAFTQVGFIPTGVGTHSVYPSRDGRTMYVVNRGTNIVGGPPHGQGSVAVLDPYTRSVVAVWGIPGGGSPDMGNITMDGSQLWLGGRYDGEVYVFDLVRGGFAARIKVGTNPHGLTVWPQPGRFSLGHTGNIR